MKAARRAPLAVAALRVATAGSPSLSLPSRSLPQGRIEWDNQGFRARQTKERHMTIVRRSDALVVGTMLLAGAAGSST
jgi:hypothetical protein